MKYNILTFALLVIFICCEANCFAQGKVTNQKRRVGTSQTSKTKTRKHFKTKIEHEVNGHEWVDLSLPSGTKWATCNVGANKPTEFGEYFSWGEIYPKSTYSVETNLLQKGNLRVNGEFMESRDVVNSDGELSISHDVANNNWRDPWRIPDKADFEELREMCDWIWTTVDNVSGYKIIAANGNSIFLPAGGLNRSDKINTAGFYWTSSIKWYEDDGSTYTYSAFKLWFYNDKIDIGPDGIWAGNLVRPVLKK